MRWLTDFIRPKIRALTQRTVTAETLWVQCSGCSQMIFQKDFEVNLNVCPQCAKHGPWPWERRLSSLFDNGQYTLGPEVNVANDPLSFRDQKRYSERLKTARQKNQRQDALQWAVGAVMGAPVVAVIFDFQFIGGSMGMAAGETLLRASQEACEKNASFLVITSSGGARMQEGILSLMQMPRSILAIQTLRRQNLPTVTLMTHPTTGGVLASFASLTDIILAEPGAIIGFTGARVIQETLRQPLPSGFQTAEFQESHGFVDRVVSRENMRQCLGNIFHVLTGRPHQGIFYA